MSGATIDFILNGGILDNDQTRWFSDYLKAPCALDDDYACWPLDKDYCIIPEDQPDYGHSEVLWWREQVLDEMRAFMEYDFYCEHCSWWGNLALSDYVIQHVYYNEWDKPRHVYVCPVCKRGL